MSSVLHEVGAERSELEWLLSSGVLGRSHNLAQMLRFLCEKHLQGQSDQISEHSIAVEALGRRTDFDPQQDTIVRVTAHTLRKRLQAIYKHEGAAHPIHVVIPSGQYAPLFVHTGAAAAAAGSQASIRAMGDAVPVLLRARWRLFSSMMLILAVLAAGAWLLAVRSSRHAVITSAFARGAASAVAAGNPVRALLGEGRKPYVDHSAFSWLPGNYCQGGSSVSEPVQPVAGTEDAPIYLGGIRGNTHCIFPAAPGIYEVHLLFAELSHLEPATSRAVFFINGSESNTIDVVDEAGGDGIATTRVFTGVRPQNDGAIHVDLLSEISLLKAVEILPAPTAAMLPVRIVAGPVAYTDPQGQVWLSDRYFFGGRFGIPPRANTTIRPSLYAHHRVGHFRYVIPVVPLRRYGVRLYFHEPWFGKQNGGTGGAESRVFDVWCNGAVLLRNFAILNEADASPVIKTFDHVESTAQGKIALDFIPVVNYPLIDAIEVLPED